MSTYAIGDIQGCFKSLTALLEKIRFNPAQDRLWIAGDMVNRGPDSLATLRFLYKIKNSVTAILGNHDLHFIAMAYGHKKPGKYDTLNKLLKAKDRDDLIQWLRHCKLVHHDKSLNYTMVHAGIPPIWSLLDALAYSGEVESLLQSEQLDEFLAQMYGDQPDCWNNSLTGFDRSRLITNYFTRMRYCRADGTLDLDNKSPPTQNTHYDTKQFLPWYAHPQHKCSKDNIVFGHWASLQGKASAANVVALDTGCVWGGKLTAFRLEDKTLFCIDSIIE